MLVAFLASAVVGFVNTLVIGGVVTRRHNRRVEESERLRKKLKAKGTQLPSPWSVPEL